MQAQLSARTWFRTKEPSPWAQVPWCLNALHRFRPLDANWIAMGSGACLLLFSSIFSSAQVPEPGIPRELESVSGPTASIPVPPRPHVYPRTEWDGRPPAAPAQDPVPKSRIIVHHSANAIELRWLELDPTSIESLNAAKGEMRKIRDIHRKDMGWTDIAYHYVIDWEGRIWAARPINSLGAHTQNHNRGSIGVALIGNLDRPPRSERETISREKQRQALEQFLFWLSWAHRVRPEAILGHHEYQATACPGRYLSRTVEEDMAAQRQGKEPSPLRQIRLNILARLRTIAGPELPRNIVRLESSVWNQARALSGTGSFDTDSLDRLFTNSRIAAPLLALSSTRESRPVSVVPPPTPPDPAALDDGRYTIPFETERIPSVLPRGRFGAWRSYGPHNGVDFRMPEGTPVFASRPGRVVFVDTHYTQAYMQTAAGRKGYGNRVIVEHPDGSETWYCHLAPGSVSVKQGDIVTNSTRLGAVGNTGHSAGPHLHFMIIDPRGVPQDPLAAIRRQPQTLIASSHALTVSN